MPLVCSQVRQVSGVGTAATSEVFYPVYPAEFQHRPAPVLHLLGLQLIVALLDTVIPCGSVGLNTCQAPEQVGRLAAGVDEGRVGAVAGSSGTAF